MILHEIQDWVTRIGLFIKIRISYKLLNLNKLCTTKTFFAYSSTCASFTLAFQFLSKIKRFYRCFFNVGYCCPCFCASNMQLTSCASNSGDLLPIIPRVRKAVIHNILKTRAFFNEDLRKCAVLSQQNRLQPNQFQKGEKHGHQCTR